MGKLALDQNVKLEELAKVYFDKKFTWAEAVFKAYLDWSSKSEVLGATATGFGGGIAGKGLICGAVTGMVMAYNLSMNRQQAEDKQLYKEIRSNVALLIDRFVEKTGALNCFDLLGYEIGTNEGMKRFDSSSDRTKKCRQFVSTASLILNEKLTQK